MAVNLKNTQTICHNCSFFLYFLLNNSLMYEKEKETIEIGIIGAGGMGRFYAQRLAKAGWKK